MRVDRKGGVDRLVCSIHAQNKLIYVVEFLNTSTVRSLRRGPLSS